MHRLIISCLLLAALLPVGPIQSAPVPKPKPKPPPVYVTIRDPDLGRYASERLDGREPLLLREYYRDCKERERECEKELADYEREDKPEPAVVHYLKRKIQKAHRQTKDAYDRWQRLAEDVAEYQRSIYTRVPAWLVEEYEREKKKKRDDPKPPRP